MSAPATHLTDSVQAPERPHWLSAVAMAAGYLLIAGTYVWISSEFAGTQSTDVDQLRRIELFKGISFIVVTAVALFVVNVTQLKKLRERDERLRRMDRALHNAERRVLAGTFASTVAHDINNGLMATTLPLSELQDKLTHQPALRELADEAQSALKRIGDWNRRFYDLGGSQLLGKVGDFDLAESVRATFRMATRHRSLRSATSEIVAPPSAPFHGSETIIQRAVLNLLLNAADAAASPTPKFRIELTQAEDGAYRIEVDDNGAGVPHELRSRIVEPFFTTKPDGTGLGLASVVACAKLHHGALDVCDSPLGGARFTLVLRELRVAGRTSR